MLRLVREYKKIAKKLSTSEMQAGAAEDELTLESLLNFGRIQSNSNFFLGVFSNSGLQYLLKEFHILEVLADMGLTNINTELETTDSHTHKLYVYSGEPNPANVICELVAKKGPLHFEEGTPEKFPEKIMAFLQVEWLLLQNPRKQFSEEKPRMPGQSHPGLGLGKELMLLLVILAKYIGLDGIVNKPHFFHTAYIFSKKFNYIAPEKQAEMEALTRDLYNPYSFFDLSWASFFECIIDKNSGNYFVWEPDFLVYPMTKSISKYFKSRDYKKKVSSHKKRLSFRLDKKKYQAKLKEHDLESKLDFNIRY